MIRKSLMKSFSVIMAAMLAMMSVACGANTVTDETATVETQAESEIEESMVTNAAVASSESEAGKVETVYVKTDANGAVNDVIVSEWLKNADASSEMSDATELKDIVNVKGSETFTDNGDGTLTWNASGADIYYQGTTDKELPVDMKITYTLDGKEISPEELAGKSGRVTIRFDYENKEKQTVEVNGKEIEVYTPFAMVSGMMLDSDKFSNVEISNGKVISDGGNYVVMGVAVPGLKESLDIDDDKWEELNEDGELDEKLTNHFEVTADTTDFELGMTITMASSDILSDFGLTDISDSDKLDDLKDDMSELNDGSTKLVDGSKELKDGTTKLRDGVTELYDGTKELKDGTKDLKDGTSSLYNGTGQLYDGTGSLYDGVVAYTDGASQVSDGAAKLADGASSAKSGADQLLQGMKDGDLVGNADKLATGANDLNAGVKTLVSTVSDMLTDSATTLATQKAYIQAALSYLEDGGTWTEATAAGFYIISSGEITSQTQVDTLRSGVYSTKTSLTGLPSQFSEMSETITTVYKSLGYAEAENEETVETGTITSGGTTEETTETTETTEETVEETTETTTESIDENGDNEEKTDENTETSVNETDTAAITETDEESEETLEASVLTMMTSSTNASALTATLTASSDETDYEELYNDLLEKYNTLTTDYTTAATRAATLKAVTDGIKEKADTYKSADIASGLKAIATYNQLEGAAKGAIAAIEGVESELALSDDASARINKLLKGANDLSLGMAAYSTGVKKVYAGTVALDEGLGTLSSGASQLSDGASKLVSNNSSLVDGVYKLKDGAYQLNDGARQLDEGAGELNDGAIKLNDGVGELNDGAIKLDDGVQELLDGVIKLDEEGIKKLYEAFDGDLTEFADRMTAIKEAGESYTSFGGASEDIDSSVKFIIKTDAIKSL